MEEAAERTKTKRGKKGKGKKSKGKRTKNTEDADQIRLQETISSSSLEGGPSLEQLSETSFPPTEEHVDIGAEVPRRSVARSDSELTSIVVVKAEDEPVTVEQSDDEKEIVSEAEKAEARCPIQQAEKAFPPRWKGKFSRLDSGASLADEVKNNTEEPEQINENVSVFIVERCKYVLTENETNKLTWCKQIRPGHETFCRGAVNISPSYLHVSNI